MDSANSNHKLEMEDVVDETTSHESMPAPEPKSSSPPTPRAPYSSLPIDKQRKQIRLLHLHPGRRGHPLRGSLKLVSLKDQPSYEALSYTWGQSTMDPQPNIILNGHTPSNLTDNLSKALQRLRRRLQTRVLWVDALCIDQDHPEERGHQVSFMGEIYKAAQQVCVWLGDIDDISFRRRLAINVTPLSYLSWPEDGWSLRIIINRLLTSNAHACGAAISMALEDAQPQWYTRAWVLQEFSNARRVSWCFGPFERYLPYDAIVTILTTSDRYEGFSSSRWSIVESFVMQLMGMDPTSRAKPFFRSSLLHNAWVADHMKATDARDKIYSLLCITTQEEAQWIKPDYSKTVAQVFAEASYASIVGSGHYDLFSYLELNKPRLDASDALPSWALDFTRRIYEGASRSTAMKLATPEQKSIAQSGPCLIAAGTCLQLEAVLFDRIDQIASTAQAHNNQAQESDGGRLLDIRPMLESSKYFLMEDNEQDVRTDFSQWAGKRRNTAEMKDTLDELAKEGGVREYLYVDDVDSIFTKWVAHISPELTEKSIRRGERKLVESWSVYMMMSDRRVQHFTTVAGFLGFASEGLAVGDVVALVDNCVSPILLRPHGPNYLFEGLAYVGGIMDGELEGFWQRNGVHGQKIVMC